MSTAAAALLLLRPLLLIFLPFLYTFPNALPSTAAVYVLLSAGISLAHPKQLQSYVQCFNILLSLLVSRVTRMQL